MLIKFRIFLYMLGKTFGWKKISATSLQSRRIIRQHFEKMLPHVVKILETGGNDDVFNAYRDEFLGPNHKDPVWIRSEMLALSNAVFADEFHVAHVGEGRFIFFKGGEKVFERFSYQ